MSGCLEAARNQRLCGGAIAYEKRIAELEATITKAHDELMNLQPHIPQCCYPTHIGFIDDHVDAAMIALNAALKGQSHG